VADQEAVELAMEAGPGPEALALAACDREQLRAAMRELAPEFREALVLRELEGLSYREIASITGVPMGTVMSRLARGRDWLRRLLRTPGREAAGR